MSYTALLAKSLPTVVGEREINFANHAVSGMATAGMLALLSENKLDLSHTDLITLCIGANNLLKPLTSTFKALMKKYNVGESFSGFDNIGDLFNELGTALESKEMTAEFQKGIDAFITDFDLILASIKKSAPAATIAVMTVYSPFKEMNITIPYLNVNLRLGDLSDKWVSELNRHIKQIAEKHNCLVVDTYDTFQNEKYCVNATFGLIPPRFSLDPHPTEKGHELLEKLHLTELEKYFNNNAVAIEPQRFAFMLYKSLPLRRHLTQSSH